MSLSSSPSFSVSDVLKNNIEDIKTNTNKALDTLMTDSQLEQPVRDEFQEIEQEIKNIIVNGGQSQDTKQEILSALNQATGSHDSVNRWICENVGIDYDKLKQNPTQNLLPEDLKTPVIGTFPLEDDQKEQPYHVVSRQEFFRKQQEAQSLFKNMRGTFKNALSEVTNKLPDDYPKDLKTEPFHEKALNIFYTNIQNTYLKNGYLPKYEDLSVLLSQACMDAFGFFAGILNWIKEITGKSSAGTDMVGKRLEMDLNTVLNAQNVLTEYTPAEEALSSCYEAGKYEKLRNDENLLDNKYGGMDPETLTQEELAYQMKYEEKQLELLESIDEYDDEKYKNEYNDGVLAGTIGVTYGVWFEKHKARDLTGMDRTIYKVKKLAKPFLKLWAIVGNVWDKFFSEKEMTWADVFKTDKKDDNPHYQKAKERYEQLQNAQEKTALLERCTNIAQHANSHHVSDLQNLSLPELKLYEEIVKGGCHYNQDADGNIDFQGHRNTLMGKSIAGLDKLENVFLLHSWEKAGYAKLETNGKFSLPGGRQFDITDSKIEDNKAFLVLMDSLYTNWPSGVAFSIPIAGSTRSIHVQNPNDRLAFNQLSASDISILSQCLQSPAVQQFLNFFTDSDVLDRIKDNTNTQPENNRISFALLQKVATTQSMITKVEITGGNIPLTTRDDDIYITIDGTAQEIKHFNNIPPLLT